MDAKTRDILERYAQRLIDSNSRSRTYFLSQLKSTDAICLYNYSLTFSDLTPAKLSQAVLKGTKLTFPYTPITPTKIKESDNLNQLIYGLTEKDKDLILKYKENKTKTNPLVSICDKYNELNRVKYLHLDNLYLNAKQLEKETGRSELYIGYPFIEGTFFSNKVFRAPLLLHEVEIQSTPNLKTIKLTGEVYINPVFMISYGIENKMPHQRFEYTLDDTKDVLNETVKYLKEKLALEVDLTKISKIIPFLSCSKNTYIDKYKPYPGEFKITNYCVVGIFPISSKSIYYDLKSIVEYNEVNPLLKKFLSKRQKDTDSIEYFNQGENETSDDLIEVITPSDITQKNIIRDSIEKNMVIIGPPGTGKSQTIVNIIASNASRGKTILVVSEKKTAIDVLYNRLDKISKYSLILRNISNDKQNFYKQLIETIENVKNLTKQNKQTVASKNRIINKFFKNVKMYSEVINSTYDGYTFLELASSKSTCSKEELNKLKAIISNYESFSEVINKFYSGEYLDIFTRLNNELTTYKTYSNFHYDLEAIKRARIVMMLKIPRGSRKYLINRLLYNLPINDYNYPIKTALFGVKLNKHSKNVFDTLQKEILKLNYNVFEEEGLMFNDPILLEFLSNNNYTQNELVQNYQRILYEDLLKENKELFKFMNNYDDEVLKITTAIDEKEVVCLQNIINKITSNILNDSNNNKDIFEGIKELERLSKLQRKKSIPHVVSKNYSALKSMYPIWLMTPEVASSILPINPNLFDLVIFDEASQMFVENAIGVLFRSKRAIVVGDNKQLRPSSVFISRYVEDEFVLDSKKMSKVNTAALEEESLLDYATHKYIQKQLRYHYRSEHKSLIAFSNAAFYENKLFFASTLVQSFDKPLEVVQVSNGLWKDNTNKNEANEVVLQFLKIIKTKKSSESIGIITFNEQQRKLISDLILKEASTNPDKDLRILINNELNRIDEVTFEDSSLFVKNIENVQGDERDIIIFSITYAKNEAGKINSNFGLLSMANGENRLNVAITRARKKIMIVKSFYSYELNINEYNLGPYYFKRYLEYCEVINNEDELNNLLKRLHKADVEVVNETNSILTTDIHSRLLKRFSESKYKKYSVKLNYNIGTFEVSLAIFKEDQFILGIKTDEVYLNRTEFDIENDYYCDKYLQSRKVNIYRIFSFNYYKNPNSEIKKILDVI